jgi:predicted phosphodiesterase
MALMKKFNCVKVVLAGHDHAGGYRNHHVHHYIFPGVVREPSSQLACVCVCMKLSEGGGATGSGRV